MSQSKLKFAAALGLSIGIAVSSHFLWLMRGTAASSSVTTHGDEVKRVPAAEVPGGRAASSGPILLSFDNVVANIGPNDSGRVHMLIFQADLELFDETSRKIIEKRQAGVKHAILELARSQSIEELKTLSGKLYFKEQIVASVNTFLNEPAIKDLHFASFLLR